MGRQTSIEAYYIALHGGTIGKRHQQILDIMLKHAEGSGLTAIEVYNIMKENIGETFLFDSNTRARFTELRNMGLLMENGTKKCSITGRVCIAWIPTWNTEVKVLIKKEKVKEYIKKLENKIIELTGKLEV